MKLVVFGIALLFGSSFVFTETLLGPHKEKVEVVEGKDLAVSCHDSESYWITPSGLRVHSEWLNITKVSRSAAGLYKCISQTLGNLLDVQLDVQYPARIVSITVPKREFSMRDDFVIELQVEGNPEPETRLTFVPENKDVFERTGTGKFTIVVRNLNCSDGGIYELTCNNSLATKTVQEGIQVFNKPALDPLILPHQKILPRLGENASFTANIISCPPVLFYDWYHGSKPISQHNDTNSSTTIYFDEVDIGDYGSYELKMENKHGNTTIPFFAEAFGVPESISDLDLDDITDKSANITFMSGFDYNDTQTFLIMDEIHGQLKSFKNISDKANDTGKLTHLLLDNLDEFTSYNLTIISHNSRGDSQPASTFVAFTTYGAPKPDPKYKIHTKATPRLGDTVNFTIHCLADPEPTFLWLHDGKHVPSLDSNKTCGSSIDLEKIKVDDFGPYTLEMQNEYGNYSISFEVKATGPPAPVTDLKVTSENNSAAVISFTTGYNYNNSQTFVVKEKKDGKVTDLAECNDTTNGKGGAEFSCEIDGLLTYTVYEVTVASRSSAGESIPSTGFISFTTYGYPRPDPKYPINKNVKPRVRDNVNLTIHSQGYPIPTYKWTHNGKVLNGTVEGYVGRLELDVSNCDDFGEYLVEVTNVVGSFNENFHLIPDGPPDPVSDLQIADVNVNSANIKFTTGYNYNKTQVFMVLHIEDGHIEIMAVCNDTTDGKGGAPFSCKLEDLKQDTLYNVTIASENSEGESNVSTDFIQFSTYGSPKPDPKFPVKNKFVPRLGQEVTLTAHAIGYPVPKFEWLHNGKPVKSADTDYQSTVDLKNLTVNEFGNYTLNITNKVGSYLTEYEILADGPPSPVTSLTVTNITDTSAVLQWNVGFNYGHKQDFKIMQRVENSEDQELDDVDDVTDGKGGKLESKSLKSLTSSTSYSVYLIAENSKGNASNSNIVKFTTSASKGGSSSHTAAIAGGVVGGLAVIVLIVVIVVVVRKRQQSSYERMKNEQSSRYHTYDDRP
ncbi:Hemicentin-1 [Mactra antiquata]